MYSNRAREHALRAVEALVTGTGTIQQRLIAAFYFNIIPLDESDGSEDEMEEVYDLTAIMTRESSSEGSVAATAHSLSDEEAKEIASRLLSLFIDTKRSKE